MIDIEKTREALDGVKKSIARNMRIITGAEYSNILSSLESDTDLCNINKAIGELERLQAKETPMKVLNKKNVWKDCPTCKMRLNEIWNNKYCDECGQALDWSDK